MEILIQVFIGVLIGVLTAIILNFRSEWKSTKETELAENEIIKESIKEILGKLLDDMYIRYTEQGWIPLDKLHQARRIYDCYHSLGGNGTGTTEIEKLEELPNYPECVGDYLDKKSEKLCCGYVNKSATKSI